MSDQFIGYLSLVILGFILIAVFWIWSRFFTVRDPLRDEKKIMRQTRAEYIKLGDRAAEEHRYLNALPFYEWALKIPLENDPDQAELERKVRQVRTAAKEERGD